MKTPSQLLLALALVALSLLPPSASRAATVRGFSLADLTASADEVVRGTVLSSHSIWHRFGAGPEVLYTVTEIEVAESFKGKTPAGDILLIMQRGGHDAGLSQTVSGTARFDDGDAVLIFARSDGALSYLVGMAQGAFFLSRPVGPKASDRNPLTWTRGPQPTIANPAPAAPHRPQAADAWQATALEVAIRELIAAQRSAP